MSLWSCIASLSDEGAYRGVIRERFSGGNVTTFEHLEGDPRQKRFSTPPLMGLKPIPFPSNRSGCSHKRSNKIALYLVRQYRELALILIRKPPTFLVSVQPGLSCLWSLDFVSWTGHIFCYIPLKQPSRYALYILDFGTVEYPKPDQWLVNVLKERLQPWYQPEMGIPVPEIPLDFLIRDDARGRYGYGESNVRGSRQDGASLDQISMIYYNIRSDAYKLEGTVSCNSSWSLSNRRWMLEDLASNCKHFESLSKYIYIYRNKITILELCSQLFVTWP